MADELFNPYESAVAPPRRVMVLFFIVDASGSMYGKKIGAVNNAIEEVLPTIRDISDSNADAEIKVAILEFNTDVKWITPGPTPAEDLVWADINAGGLTALGAACEELNRKLSRDAFMSEVVGSYAPVLFLLSDGAPTDNFVAGLNALKQNNWYKAAMKVAIAIGNDADKDMLAQFTGSIESVITVHTPEELKKWIKFVSVTSSQIGSKSSSVDSKSKQEGLEDEIKNGPTPVDPIDIDPVDQNNGTVSPVIPKGIW